jgi:LysR family transcriptional regulator, nitrogen assimilation regulatory protein
LISLEDAVIQLRQLRYFVAIVDSGSFSRAATMVYVAQSALSSQIAELEQELGIMLLHRTPRGARPTAAGEVMYRDATHILRLFEKIPQNVRATGLEAAGPVSIGMSSTLAGFLATSFIKACKDALPNVNLSFLTEDSVSLRNRLVQHTLDLAVLFEEEPLAGLTRTELFRQRLFLLHMDQARRQTSGLSLAQVARWPLILPAPPNGLRRLLDREFSTAGLSVQIVAEIHNFAGGIAAVHSGIGATILPMGDLSVIPGADGIIVTPIDGPMRVTASLVYPEDVPLSPAAAAVRSVMVPFVNSYVQEHQPLGMEVISPE